MRNHWSYWVGKYRTRRWGIGACRGRKDYIGQGGYRTRKEEKKNIKAQDNTEEAENKTKNKKKVRVSNPEPRNSIGRPQGSTSKEYNKDKDRKLNI
jgi:hypothetical protein